MGFTRLFLLSAILVLSLSGCGSNQGGASANDQEFAGGTQKYSASHITAKAEQDWTLNCQGCHKIDGTGRPEKGLPNLTGQVAKFLHVDGGREYLARVPGVTNATINDEDLTALLNWLLPRFDPDHIPEDHKLYTVEEVTRWRQHPLSINAEKKRKHLLVMMQGHTIK